MFHKIQKNASRLSRCIAPLISAWGASSDAFAASDADVKAIYAAVRSRFPDFSAYCKLSDDERRQTVVKTTMALASTGKVSDPFGAGLQAGTRLRGECGQELAPVVTRWLSVAKPLTFDTERRPLGFFTTRKPWRTACTRRRGAFPAVGSVRPRSWAPIFSKTGAKRQADLVSLLLASPAYFLAQRDAG